MKKKIIAVTLVVAALFIGTGAFVVFSDDENLANLNEEQRVALDCLLGDYSEDALTFTRNQVAGHLIEIDELKTAREKENNFEMSEREQELWEKITKVLDWETIRHVGIKPPNDFQNESEEDKGKVVMENLKGVLSKEDFEEVKRIRDEYLEYYYGEGEISDTVENAPDLIKDIIKKYPELDGMAVQLNVLEDKNSEVIGLLNIEDPYKAVYMTGAAVGLKQADKKQIGKMRKTWGNITEILPEDVFQDFVYFKSFSDGEYGTVAYVMNLDETGKYWMMGVDPNDITDDGYFPYTVVHEIFHYITLNDTQVEYPKSKEDISFPEDMYWDGEALGKEGSYIQEFYRKFWQPITHDRDTNPDNPYFYERHKSEFVTDYAATACCEDMSESFSAYVLSKEKPTANQQKKWDFYDSYPELRAFKKAVLENIEKNNIHVNREIG